MNNHIFSILLILLFYSCGSKEFNSEEALWSHVKNPKNGYMQEKSVNRVDFTLLYKPTDLIVAQEIVAKDATQKEIDSLRNKYGLYAYFNLSMSKGNQELLNNLVGDRNQFGEMVNTLAFGMEDKIHLYTSKKDTIPMMDYVYPRMYGLSKNTSLLLVYPKEEIEDSQEINMSIKDLGFGTGDISFKYDQSLFKKNPHINFN